MRLNNWCVFRDVLLGEAQGHPKFEENQRVMSNKIKRIDRDLGIAICIADKGTPQDEIWVLGQPASLARYEDPIGKKVF